MSEKKLSFDTKFISGSTLKIIACISMFIDHLSLILWKHNMGVVTELDYDSIQYYRQLYRIGRNIGRIAFPIYCFLLTEGFRHTKDLRKYIIRLMIMALASEHAFNLMVGNAHLDNTHQNVFFTLAISLITVTVIHKVKFSDKFSESAKTILIMGITLSGCLLAYVLKTDYSYKGVFSVVVIYLLSYSRLASCLGGAISFSWEPWATPAFIPIFFYNGKRGLKAKYFFYLFYPLHIYLIYFIVRL